MFANTLRRVSSNLRQPSCNIFMQSLKNGRSNQLFAPVSNRFFANNVRDDKQTTKGADFANPTQGASKDNSGIGAKHERDNWREAAKNEPTGGVKIPAKEWSSEIKDKIREPAGNTASAKAGHSNEWAAPGSAKDTLKNPNSAGQKGSLDAEERHYVGTAGTEIPKGKKANQSGNDAKEDTHGSVHETEQRGRGTTYVGIKGAKPDYSGDAAKTQGNPDISGGTASQYPGDTSKGSSTKAAGTSKSNVTSDDAPQSNTGNVQDRNINNLGRGNKK